MRITAASFLLTLPAAGLTALLLVCAYIMGYWRFFGEPWLSVFSVQRLVSIPGDLMIGFGLIAITYVCTLTQLTRYAIGCMLNESALLGFALATLAVMYLATYAQFSLIDLYPFVTVFIISMLIFRTEHRAVAAILIGAILLGFYLVGASELGERDAKHASTYGDTTVHRVT